MPLYFWNEDKNRQLIRERGVSFEEIVLHLRNGGLLDTRVHHNQERYPGQRIYIVRIGEYAYEVPFLQSDDIVFLKTIIPSRRATRDYLRRRNSDV